MNIKIGVSNRHVHLSNEDFAILFGNKSLEKYKDLSQPGQFASTSIVTLKTNKSIIENVRVVGPLRSYTQVEISKTDSYKLGINPPIRNSGDLKDAEEITIIGPNGSITKKCCIIATRHIHISLEQLKTLNLSDREFVDIFIPGEKSTILKDVYLKSSAVATLELHLDTDDANGCLVKNGDIARIII